MQLFRSEEDVDNWCQQTERPKGAVFGLDQLWPLAQRWYDDRLDAEWSRRSIEQRERILESVGLSDEFWRLSNQPPS